MGNSFNVEQYINIVSKFIEGKLKEYNLELSEVLEKSNSENIKIHNEILRLMTSTFSSAEELKKYCPTDEIKAINDYKDYNQKVLINTYFNEFIDLGFIDFKDSIIKEKDCTIDPNENYAYFRNKINHNEHKYFPLFIMPDGTCYFSPAMHFILAKWLHVHGIDFKKAIRVECINGSKFLSIGNSNQYNNGNHVEGELLISDEQADAIAKIYKVLQDGLQLAPIENTLVISDGLGLKTNSFIGKLNLRKLDNAFGKGFINKKLLRELRNDYCM